MITLGAIRAWRMFAYILTYIGFRPIKTYIIKRLNESGIGVQGAEPHDMLVHNDSVYQRMVYDGTLGLGEAYMDGWWECQKLDVFFHKCYLAGLYREMTFPWDRLIHYLEFDVFNRQTVVRSWEVAEKHYDLGKFLRF